MVVKTIMRTFLNKDLGTVYKSPSQKIRVLTEEWASEEVFCPSCGAYINRYEHNRPVADFYCPICKEDYELKGKGGSFGSKIINGAFETTIERLKGNLNPKKPLNKPSATESCINLGLISLGKVVLEGYFSCFKSFISPF